MPNFKIIQDVADEARVKIYGSQDTALNTDSSGNLVVTATATGLVVTTGDQGLLVTSTGLPVISSLATTDVLYAASGAVTGSGYVTPTINVLGIDDWTFSVVNASAAGTTITAVLLGSPDSAHAINNSSVVTLGGGSLAGLVPSVFFKYAQVSYSVVAGPANVNFYFQGQS